MSSHIRSIYYVTVGNVGTVYVGNSPTTARKVFAEYVTATKRPAGRASGEGVVLFRDSEPIREHAATFEHI